MTPCLQYNHNLFVKENKRKSIPKSSRNVHTTISNYIYESTQQLRGRVDTQLQQLFLEYCKHFQDAIFRDDKTFTQWVHLFQKKYGFVLHEDSLQLMLDTLHSEAVTRGFDQYSCFIEQLKFGDNLNTFSVRFFSEILVNKNIYNTWLRHEFEIGFILMPTPPVAKPTVSQDLNNSIADYTKKYITYDKFPPEAKSLVDDLQRQYIAEIRSGKSLSQITQNVAEMAGYKMHPVSFGLLLNKITSDVRRNFSNAERELFYKKVLKSDDIGVLQRSSTNKKELILQKNAETNYSAYLKKVSPSVPESAPVDLPKVFEDTNIRPPKDLSVLQKANNIQNKRDINVSKNPDVVPKDMPENVVSPNKVTPVEINENSTATTEIRDVPSQIPVQDLPQPPLESPKILDIGCNYGNGGDETSSPTTSSTFDDKKTPSFEELKEPNNAPIPDTKPLEVKIPETVNLADSPYRIPATTVDTFSPSETPSGMGNQQIAVITLLCFAVILTLAWYERTYHPERANPPAVEQSSAENLHSVFEPIISYQEILTKLVICAIPISLVIVYNLRFYYFYRICGYFKMTTL